MVSLIKGQRAQVKIYEAPNKDAKGTYQRISRRFVLWTWIRETNILVWAPDQNLRGFILRILSPYFF